MHWSYFIPIFLFLASFVLLFSGVLGIPFTDLNRHLSEKQRKRDFMFCKISLIVGFCLVPWQILVCVYGKNKKIILEEKTISVHLLSIEFQHSKYSYVICKFMDLDRGNKIVEKRIRSINWNFGKNTENFPDKTKRIKYLDEPQGIFKFCGAPSKEEYEYPEIENVSN